MDKDIEQKVADYSACYKAKKRTDTFTERNAREEIVADYMGEILNGNQAMIDRLVCDDRTLGQKIRNLIYDTLDKFTGVKDPQIEQMKKVVKMFDKALKVSGNGPKKTKYQLGEYGLSTIDQDLASNILFRGQEIVSNHNGLSKHVSSAISTKEQKQFILEE